MNVVLKFEEIGLVLLGVFGFSFLHYSWWWFLVLFLAPDIGMLGYLFGNKAGAVSYNIFHHKGLAVLLWMGGFVAENEILQLIGVILLTHSAFDRILGYGLKYKKGFKFTHLGEIGK